MYVSWSLPKVGWRCHGQERSGCWIGATCDLPHASSLQPPATNICSLPPSQPTYVQPLFTDALLLPSPAAGYTSSRWPQVKDNPPALILIGNVYEDTSPPDLTILITEPSFTYHSGLTDGFGPRSWQACQAAFLSGHLLSARPPETSNWGESRQRRTSCAPSLVSSAACCFIFAIFLGSSSAFFSLFLFLFFLETYFPSVPLYLLLLRYKFGSCLWITCPSHQLTSWLSTARDDLCPWLNASCVFRQLSTFHNWVTLSTLSGLLIFSNRTVPNKYFENISRDVNFIGLDRKY